MTAPRTLISIPPSELHANVILRHQQVIQSSFFEQCFKYLTILDPESVERDNETGALQPLGADSPLLVAGAPFIGGAAIRAGRD
jgi:hypothetical protein